MSIDDKLQIHGKYEMVIFEETPRPIFKVSAISILKRVAAAAVDTAPGEFVTFVLPTNVDIFMGGPIGLSEDEVN